MIAACLIFAGSLWLEADRAEPRDLARSAAFPPARCLLLPAGTALRVVEAAAESGKATPVELFAVSMRRPSEDERLRFSGERTLTPRFARMVISIPKDRPKGEIQWPSSSNDTGNAFSARAFEALDRDAFRANLEAAGGRERRAACARFRAWLQHALR